MLSSDSYYDAMLDIMYSLLNSHTWENEEGAISRLELPFFPEQCITKLVVSVRKIFESEENLMHISSPITIVGDLHGNIIDFLKILKTHGAPPWTRYLFLGDLVDRGEFSVETITFIYLLKVKYPQDVFIIRGNHEVDAVCSKYGFKSEIIKKYNSEKLYQTFINTFNYTPMAALIDSRILCIHGGIGPSVKTMNDIANIKRPISMITKNTPAYDLLWSDPYEDAIIFERNPRGFGHLFGKKHLIDFELKNALSLVVRGHEVATNGIYYGYDGKLVTVFSSSDYCHLNNDSGVLKILESGATEVFTYKPLPKKICSSDVDFLGITEAELEKHQIHSDNVQNVKPQDDFNFTVPNQYIKCLHAKMKAEKLKQFIENEHSKASISLKSTHKKGNNMLFPNDAADLAPKRKIHHFDTPQGISDDASVVSIRRKMSGRKKKKPAKKRRCSSANVPKKKKTMKRSLSPLQKKIENVFKNF